MNDFPKELFLRPRTAKILAVGRADKEILVLVVQVLRDSPSKNFFSYESLKSRKRRARTWKPLSQPRKVVCRHNTRRGREKVKEKKKTKEGEKVAPRRKGSVYPQPRISFFGSRVFGF
jgi:hypothetical protein